jgi:hypothetical protein
MSNLSIFIIYPQKINLLNETSLHILRFLKLFDKAEFFYIINLNFCY